MMKSGKARKDPDRLIRPAIFLKLSEEEYEKVREHSDKAGISGAELARRGLRLMGVIA